MFLEGWHELTIIVRLPEVNKEKSFSTHLLCYHLENKVQLHKTPTVCVMPGSGKVDIKILKAESNENATYLTWKTLGSVIKQDVAMDTHRFRPWIIARKFPVTHDVYHYVLKPNSEVSKYHIRKKR